MKPAVRIRDGILRTGSHPQGAGFVMCSAESVPVAARDPDVRGVVARKLISDSEDRVIHRIGERVLSSIGREIHERARHSEFIVLERTAIDPAADCIGR